MWITIICIIVTIFGSILEYKRSNSKDDGKNSKFSRIILIIGILGLIGNNIKQTIDNNELYQNFNTIQQENKSLSQKLDTARLEIKNISEKNDSLKFQNEIITHKLDLTQGKLNEISKTTESGFQDNERYFQSIDTKNLERQRILSNSQKDILFNELNKHAGTKIRIEYQTSDSETARYAKQFIEIFKQSEWDVEIRAYLAGGTDHQMYEINIIIKDSEYKPMRNVYKSLENSFTLSGLKFKFRINANLESKDLIVLYIDKG